MTESYTITLQNHTYTIREDMVDALHRYVEHRLPPGDFLTAVLAHDLVRACQHADHWNLPNLPAYAHYLHWELPGICHGSYERVDAWLRGQNYDDVKEIRTGNSAGS